MTFTGEGTPGETITVRRAHNNKVAGTGTVGADGTWKLDADFNWGTWSAKVTESNDESVILVSNFQVIDY